uniref:Uncharacterized protein n=1 Tax=Panagrolaimus sp. ES5 TaxID=591445 RepID=A0AC34FGR9_9BILA
MDVPIPIFQKQAREDYISLNDFDDVLTNAFTMENYLNSIVAIGIENNTESLYLWLKDVSDTTDSVKTQIQNLLNEETGIFVQTTFSMSSKKEAILRKAAMLIAINKDGKYRNGNIMDEVESLCEGVFDDFADLETYGSMCLRVHKLLNLI